VSAVEPVLGRQPLWGYVIRDADEAVAVLTERGRRSGRQQRVIAEKAGVAQSSLCRWMGGNRGLSARSLIAWAAAEGLRVAFIPEEGSE
jgi:transcriptional regulator with XRE-family HTH domain